MPTRKVRQCLKAHNCKLHRNLPTRHILSDWFSQPATMYWRGFLSGSEWPRFMYIMFRVSGRTVPGKLLYNNTRYSVCPMSWREIPRPSRTNQLSYMHNRAFLPTWKHRTITLQWRCFVLPSRKCFLQAGAGRIVQKCKLRFSTVLCSIKYTL